MLVRYTRESPKNKNNILVDLSITDSVCITSFFFFFFFIYYLTRLQSQKSKLWSFLAVRVLALSRPEVSASSYEQRTKRERGERRKKICTFRLEKQQGAWMNGVQTWGYSSLIINSKNFREHQLPKASSASSDGCTPVF